MNQCNQCSKQVADYRAEKGWIRISAMGAGTMIVSNGEVPVNPRQTSPSRQLGLPADFCSLNCLTKFIASIKPTV